MQVEQSTDVQVYTDGAVAEGQRNGGFGFVVVQHGQCVHQGCGAVGQECISYEAEVAAMSRAIQWLQGWLPHARSRVAIITDSMATVLAVRRARNYNDAALRDMVQCLLVLANSHSVEIHWVPSHVGIRGNEEADRMAGAGTQCEQPTSRTWETVRRLLRRVEHITPPTRGRYREIYKEAPASHNGPRNEQVLLSQLRAGFCPRTGHYRARINAGSPNCGKCGEVERTADHWWECDSMIHARRTTWGAATLAEALRDPDKLIAYVRSHWPEWLEELQHQQ
jgi:ribonuclease HI